MRLLLPEQRLLGSDDLLELYDSGEKTILRGGFVLSVDGSIAADGSSRPLQTPADQLAYAALRAVADAVVVGAGTARTENYGPVRHRPAAAAWRVDHGRTPAPLVLVTRGADLDPGARCFTGDVPTLVVTCAAARPSAALRRVADVLIAGDDDVDLTAAVAALHARGLTRLLCEGGPSLLTALLGAGLVDELCLTLSPLLIGTAPALLTTTLPAPVRLQLRHLVDGGEGSLLTRYAII